MIPPASINVAEPSSPLTVALLGAGIFASTAHAPVLLGNTDIFTTAAVFSRSTARAETLAAKFPSATAYTDLEQVLQRPDIEAVIMALPLDVQPDYVRQVLEAGKHILSEKPIAPTLQEATALLEEYHSKYAHQGMVWSVAENFRYEPALLHAAKVVQTSNDENYNNNDGIGRPFLLNLKQQSPFTPDNKYLQTKWRNQPSWYGGLFVDAFMHTAAMLRLVLGQDAQQVSIQTMSVAEHIPSIDTMAGQVTWKNDKSNDNDDDDNLIQGVLSVAYACSTMKMELEIVGTQGTLLLCRKTDGPGYSLTIFKSNDNSNKSTAEPVHLDFGFGGIEQELFHFAAACQQRGTDRNTPAQATSDLAFVEACLESGKNQGATTKVQKLDSSR